jgi:hypothetical protein
MPLLRYILGSSLLLALAGAADAQATFFGDDDPRDSLANSIAARNAFLANLFTFGTDDIESYPDFLPQPTLSFGALGITSSTTVEFVAPFPQLAISGDKLLLGNLGGDFQNPIPNQSDVFVLSSPVEGFGMFFTEVGDLTNETTLALVLENTILNTSKNVPIGTFTGRQTDAVFFFGIIDADPFNRVTLTKATTGNAVDGILFDDVSVGFATVPEPSVLLLLAGAAVGGTAAWSRRKKLARPFWQAG